MTGRPKTGDSARFKSLPDLAYEQLREQILSGAFAAGSQLKQEKIAAELEVSRLPVREALARLEADRLVVLRPRRGYVVAPLSLGEIEEIFELRMLLEEYAARLATRHRTKEDVEEVKLIYEEMQALAPETTEEFTEFSQFNRSFHERIFQSAGRNNLSSVLKTTQDGAERYVVMGARLLNDLSHARREHKLIFEAFRDGDEELAAKYSRDHARETCRRLVNTLEKSLIEG